MARGQAFETMMLVISVIVALAILGVLLSILTNVGPNPGGDPKSTMKDNFRDLHSSGGIGIKSPKKVSFKKGDTVLPRELTGQTPIQSGSIKFVCADSDEICSGKPIQVDDNMITAEANAEVTLVTCANEENTDGEYTYFAAFSRAEKPGDATKACIEEANLN